MKEVKLPKEVVDSRKVESNQTSMRVTMRVTNAAGQKNETVLMLTPLLDSTNKSVTVSFWTIQQYMATQKSSAEDTGLNDRAKVLLTALEELNTIQFFDNLTGEEVTLYTSGIKLRKSKSGIEFYSITWYSEDNKTVLGFEPTKTDKFKEFLDEVQRQYESAVERAKQIK